MRSIMIFIILGFVTVKSFCQINEAKLKNLKEKYTWGSIYITYISFINLRSILKDDQKLHYIQGQYTQSSIATLQAFLSRYKSAGSSESIAFIEIDLNRIEAGYKSPNDIGGEITTIPWSKEDVVEIADLCDKQLTAFTYLNNTLSAINGDSIPLSIALFRVNKLKDSAYISTEAYYIVAKSFRALVSEKAALMPQYPINERAAFKRFEKEFDQNDLMIMSNEPFKENILELKKGVNKYLILNNKPESLKF